MVVEGRAKRRPAKTGMTWLECVVDDMLAVSMIGQPADFAVSVSTHVPLAPVSIMA